ncbi:MAG: putative toxin-antitoxin system toxin component, PIN family [Abditibacteriales bacterium]|nr:putative toxin-antitoxin system toxin component, PIN family [Abditibacteriales bacterium]
MLTEVKDVLTRPKTRRQFPFITTEGVMTLLQRLADKAVYVKDVPKQFTYDRDPKDEPYVNLALAVGAHYLVSWDNDLLDLMREETAEGKQFRERFPI